MKMNSRSQAAIFKRMYDEGIAKGQETGDKLHHFADTLLAEIGFENVELEWLDSPRTPDTQPLLGDQYKNLLITGAGVVHGVLNVPILSGIALPLPLSIKKTETRTEGIKWFGTVGGSTELFDPSNDERKGDAVRVVIQEIERQIRALASYPVAPPLG